MAEKNVWYVDCKHPSMTRWEYLESFSKFYEAIDYAVEYSKKHIHIKVRIVDSVTDKNVMMIDK